MSSRIIGHSRMKKPRRTTLLKFRSLRRRVFYISAAILIVFSGIVWWRPQKAHAQTDTFTTSGTWSVPAGVSSADFEAWGAGGAGGAGANQGGTIRGGGGGKGGEYAIKNVTGLVTSDVYTITVAGTTASGNGNPSSVADPSSTTFVNACGGSAGSDATTGSDGAGATAQTTGCTHLGTSFNSGGNGASGATNGGGGGGGGGSTGTGGNASGSTAGTGTSTNGGNGGGGATANGAGSNGSIYGGAGGGGRRGGNAGGTGAQGLVTVTYTIVNTYTQTSYELFANADDTAPGTPLAAQNTPVTLSSSGQRFRIRQLIKPVGNVINNTLILKEQYADRSAYGTCSAIPNGNWNDVSSTGSITFYNNPTAVDGSNISYQNGTDPTDTSTLWLGQSYKESNPFDNTNTFSTGYSGEWDLSLTDNAAPANTTYCFRTVLSSGTPLDAYDQYPMITTYNPPTNSAPSSPALTAPSSGATGVSATPTFSFSDTDTDGDDIQFKINLFQSDCSTSVTTYDMASGQTGWATTFNGSAASGLSYSSFTAGGGLSFTPSSALSAGTIYCWSVSAIDPDGSNTTTTSGTQSFTTAAVGGTEQLNIGGGVNITGGTNVY